MLLCFSFSPSGRLDPYLKSSTQDFQGFFYLTNMAAVVQIHQAPDHSLGDSKAFSQAHITHTSFPHSRVQR